MKTFVGKVVSVGMQNTVVVKIGETRPISRDKHFKIIEIVSEVRKEKKS